MSDESKKRQVLFVGLTSVLIAFFAYAFYFVMGEIASAKTEYVERYKELIGLEEQQREVARLEKELLKNSEDLQTIGTALIEQSYDNKLKLVIDIENVGKSLGLAYDLNIVKEVTKESLVEEKARLARSRRQSQIQTEEDFEEKFPSIVFSVKLKGPYPAIVGFIEKLQRLPYYSKIESFTISSRRVQEEAMGGVEATIEFLVFTK